MPVFNNYPSPSTNHLPSDIQEESLQGNSLYAPVPTSLVLAFHFSKRQLYFSSNLAKETLRVILTSLYFSLVAYSVHDYHCSPR